MRMLFGDVNNEANEAFLLACLLGRQVLIWL
jgi:hypothetical protein